MTSVTLAGSASQVIDQQETEKRPGTLDEAIVIACIGIPIDEILELGREPTDALHPRAERWTALQVQEITCRGHETATDVL
jgi:hypothetical protein